MCQTCQRWTLLTKSNFGHSTLTVDSALFKVNGFVPIVDFKSSGTSEATLDMTALYGNLVSSAKRKFLQENDHSVLIEDDVVMNDSTKLLNWAVMTTADVIPVKNGALLKQDGKELKLEILSPANVEVSIIMMDPPPLELDKKIPHLKRVEVRVPAYLFPEKSAAIKVRLSAPE
jgi:hypothetical protein